MLLPSEKGSTLSGKEMQTPFQNGLGVQKCKQEVTRDGVGWGDEDLPCVSSPLKMKG